MTPEPTTVTPEPTPQEPTPTPGEPSPTPGEPTPTPGGSTATTVPPNPTSVVTLAPPASSDSSPILIPVTGSDLSSNKTQELYKSILFNLGLGMLGIGLILQGIFRKNR